MLVSILASGNIPYKENALLILEDFLRSKNIRYKIVEKVSFDTKSSHPSWWKLMCHKIHENEDYILNWDLDLLPSNRDVPFHKLDENKLGLAWDTSAKFNPESRYNNNFKYNGGLIGVPKSMSTFCEKIFHDFAPGVRPSYEQYYLNDRIAEENIQVYEFDDESNFLYRDHDPYIFNLFLAANYKHYTCLGRDKLIEQHRKKYFNE